MFRFTLTSTARAALLAAAVALFASHSALAARPSDPHDRGDIQTTSRAGDASDRGVSAEYASRGGDRQDGANADA
jgi:hypothetical protein